jgi:hypothetical protein
MVKVLQLERSGGCALRLIVYNSVKKEEGCTHERDGMTTRSRQERFTRSDRFVADRVLQ